MRKQWIIGALAATLIAVVFRQTFVWLAHSWLASPYYSHGWLIPPIAAALAFRQQRRRQDAGEATYAWPGVLIVAVGLAAHTVAVRRGFWIASAFSLIAVVAGAVWGLAGLGALRRQAFPVAFLLLMVPLPWLEELSPGLARGVASAAAAIAGGLGLAVSAQGAQLQLAGAALAVGAPCSGLNSLAALVTLAALYAHLAEGPLAGRVGLVLLAIPIALLANLTRIVLLILVAQAFGVDAALRYFHDWSGLVLFGLAVALLVLIGKVLRCRPGSVL
jgi:exosortase